MATKLAKCCPFSYNNAGDMQHNLNGTLLLEKHYLSNELGKKQYLKHFPTSPKSLGEEQLQ